MRRVLVASLDWGLGHATRCIPIIRELLHESCDVYLAGSGPSLRLLTQEFPQLKAYQLPGYQPVYPTDASFFWTMMTQVPRFLRTIRREHQLLRDLVQELDLELVISDNRYGCWASAIPSVLITHQLTIMTGVGYSLWSPVINAVHRRLINRFDFCWVPDVPGADSLAGQLSSFPEGAITCPVTYIGHLSRFSARAIPAKRYDIVCVLSGPEPQRSVFEQIVSDQLRTSGLRYVIAGGLPGSDKSDASSDYIPYADAQELQWLLQSARVVVARSGYSTIMDMAALGLKAILVPTPGQPEQEYLANRLMSARICYTMSQDKFDLVLALKRSAEFSGFGSYPHTPASISHHLDSILRKSPYQETIR